MEYSDIHFETTNQQAVFVIENCGNYTPFIRMNDYPVRMYGIYGIFMQHENYLQEIMYLESKVF